MQGDQETRARFFQINIKILSQQYLFILLLTIMRQKLFIIIRIKKYS
jgi:hypothetical protein